MLIGPEIPAPKHNKNIFLSLWTRWQTRLSLETSKTNLAGRRESWKSLLPSPTDQRFVTTRRFWKAPV